MNRTAPLFAAENSKSAMNLRIFIPSLALVAIGFLFLRTISLAAEETVTFTSWMTFHGFSSDNKKIGDRGHRILASEFTGRWYCAAIGIGTLGPHPNVPFAAPGFSTVDQKVVAIVAIDVQSKETRCLTFLDKARPNWEDFRLRVRSEDQICVFVRHASTSEGRIHCDIIDVTLSVQTIKLKQLDGDMDVAEQEIARNLPDENNAGGKNDDQTQSRASKNSDYGEWLRNSGNFREIDTNPDSPSDDSERNIAGQRFLWHGSQSSRVIQFNVIGESQFALSESEKSGRILWLLTESSFSSISDNENAPIVSVFLPATRIPPTKRTILITQSKGAFWTLFEVRDGVLRKIDVPFTQGVRIHGFFVSKNQEFATINFINHRASTDEILVVRLDSQELSIFKDEETTDRIGDSLHVIGITDSGSIVGELNNAVYLGEPSGRLRFIQQVILSRE